MTAKARGVTGIQKINSLAYLALVISCVALIGTYVFHNEGVLNSILAGYICVGYACLLAFAWAQIRKCKDEKPVAAAILFPGLLTVLNVLGGALISVTGRADFFWSVTIWGWFISILFAIKRNRESNDFPLEGLQKKHKTLLCVVVAVTVFVCAAPMGSSPFWRSKEGQGLLAWKKEKGGFPVPAYAVLADALLAGKLNVDLPVDPKLLKMDNLYDPKARRKQKVNYYHDFVLYDGKYYVYYGVVPALLLFAPYQLLTGSALPTFHSTQIFGALTIIGIFALFFLLAKTFFKRVPFSLYVAGAMVFSLLSISFAILHGNQYSTAVVSGVCFEVWSMYFFVRAGWRETTACSRIRHLFFGSLCGALVFGCRPPVGLANLALIPVLVRMWCLFPDLTRKQRIAKFLLGMTPYLVVAIALMLYNHARFDSPFEFGVKYNLTHLDSTAYSFDFTRAVNMVMDYLFAFPMTSPEFPFVTFFGGRFSILGGVFFNYPILLLIFLLASRTIYGFLKVRQLYWLSVSLAAGALAVLTLDVCAAPWWLHERNKMDFYFLLSIASFITLCAYYEISSETLQKAITLVFPYAALLTVVTMILLQLVPFERNFTREHKDFNAQLAKILLFQNVSPSPSSQ